MCAVLYISKINLLSSVVTSLARYSNKRRLIINRSYVFITRNIWKFCVLLIMLIIIDDIYINYSSPSTFFTFRLRPQNYFRYPFVKFRNLSILINTCEQMSTIDCLNYLHYNKSNYFQVLSSNEGIIFHNEYCTNEKKMLFHTFWSNPRKLDDPLLLLHIQSHLYTQNRQCSNLIIWTLPRVFRDIAQKYNVHEPYLQFRSLMPLANELRQVGVNIDSLWSRLRGAAPSTTAAVVSDAVRFVVLHKYGGMYIDADILLLRDLQPFYMHEFTYRWSTLDEYNTAVLRLHSKSNISSKLLDLAGQNRDPSIFFPTKIRSYLDPITLNRLPSVFFDPLWLVADLADWKSIKLWNLTNNARETFETVFHKESKFSQQGRNALNGAFTFHWHALHRADKFEQGSYLYQWNEFLRTELFNSNS